MEPEFVGFPKIARLSRECLITEKIDGTNAQILISNDGAIRAGSRNRWLTPAFRSKPFIDSGDNFGFARWVAEHFDELLTLGPGRHFGEWWGQGIQRRYGLAERRFSLFNVSRWCKESPPDENQTVVPDCCHVVPVLYRGPFATQAVDESLERLRSSGSFAAPGFANPEGVVIYHVAGNVAFKKTLANDDGPKTAA